MKRRLLHFCGLIALGSLGLAAGPAATDTIVAGPFYGPYYPMPAWDQTLPASRRFLVLPNMNGEAVLDYETGLVWEKSPSTAVSRNDPVDWESAQSHCNWIRKGNRMGWRLPTVHELASLVDPSADAPGPALPLGHPFQNVQDEYWSATSYATNEDKAWSVSFGESATAFVILKSVHVFAWCVRGGQGAQ
jgi:hypothetical protein